MEHWRRVVCCLACASCTVTAVSGAEIQPFTVDSTPFLALGGYHSAHNTDIFCLFSNPAALDAVQYRSLFQLGLGAIGSIEEDLALLRAMGNGEAADADMVAGYAKSALGYTPPFLYMNGPFAIGYAAKGFGAAVFNRVFYDAALYRKRWTINMNIDLTGAAGWALNLVDNYTHKLDAGLGVRLHGRYMFNVLSQNVAALPKEPGPGDAASRADKIVLGLGTSVGVMYRFRSLLTLGIDCDDVFAPYLFLFLIDKESGEDDFALGRQKLNVGFSITPVENAFARLTIMADARDILAMAGVSGEGREAALFFSAGIEAIFSGLLTVRAGLKDLLPAAGLGYNFGTFSIEAAFYGKEFGITAGQRAVYALDLGFRFY
ncbi:MAG: hypothetical protein LBC72_01840 [Spirochaetaceae bacterium]|jgi:hypothetical protein|nr:hypothetical protein [Spirochaetaceae bacterium]